MGLLVTAGLALAGIMLAATPAGARSAFDVRDYESVTAPYALAGERLLAYEPPVGRDPGRLLLLEPGGVARRLDDFAGLLAFDPPELRPDDELGGYETTYWNLALGASSRRLAASVSLLLVSDDSLAPNYPFYAGATRLWTRGVGKPAAPTARCGPEDPNGLALAPIDVEGDVIAYGGGGCASGRSSIGTVDLVVGASSRRTLVGPAAEVFSTVRLSGRFVAGGTAASLGPNPSVGRIVVFDRASGAELYRVSGWSDLGRRFDILSDGRIVAVDAAASGPGLRLVWFSASEPWPHQLDYAPCGDERPEAAGDRFVMARALGPRDASGNQPCEWTLGTLQSPGVNGLFERGAGRMTRLLRAFDGKRIAVDSSGCIGTRVEVGDPLAFAGSLPSAPSCDFDVVGSSDVTVPARGSLSLTVRCPSSCRGTAGLRDTKTGRVLGLERMGRSITAERFLLRGPRMSRLSLRLDRRERDLILRKGRFAVALDARVVQIDGGRRRFRAALALRARPTDRRRGARAGSR